MLINKDTINLVSSLKNINESIIFNYPITGIKDNTSGALVFIDMEKLGNKEFKPFALAKIAEFIELVRIMSSSKNLSDTNNNDDLNIDIDEKGIIHLSSKDFNAKYISSDIGVLENIAGVKIDIFEKIKSKKSICNFVLRKEFCEKIKKASDLLSLNEISFSLKDGVDIKCLSDSDNNKKFSLKIQGDDLLLLEDNLNFSMQLIALKKIPLADFKCFVRVNENDDSILAFHLTPIDFDYINFIIPCEINK